MILDVNTYKYKTMSSYININLIKFEYRGSWFAEAPGQIKKKCLSCGKMNMIEKLIF